MRIGERIARLERREGEFPSISADEMAAAAQRYEAALIHDGVPDGGSVQDALATWRDVVVNCQPWARRPFLNCDPMDLYA